MLREAVLCCGLLIAGNANGQSAATTATTDGGFLAPPPRDSVPANVQGDARLHVESIDPQAEKRGWQQVPCVLPCQIPLARSLRYRFAGEGMANSAAFGVPRVAAALDVTGLPGRPHVRRAGIAFLAISFPVGVAGFSLLVASAFIRSEYEKPFQIAAGSMFAVSFPMTASGIAMAVVGRARADVDVTARLPEYAVP